MIRLRLASIVVAGLVAGGGCATLSFKAGAGPDRMATDEHACGQAGSEGFVDCMRNLGWYVSDGTIGEPPMPADVTPVAWPSDVATPSATPKAAPQAIAPSPPAALIAAPAPVAAPKAVPVVPVAAVTAVPTATALPAAAAAEPAVAPAEAPVAAGSLPTVKVGSWWKLGGSAAALDSSIAGCVAKLGPPHQPNANATVVTVAMRDCLRADGWYSYNEFPVQYVPPQR